MAKRIEREPDEDAIEPRGAGARPSERWRDESEDADTDVAPPADGYRRRRAPVRVRRNRWRDALEFWRAWRRVALVVAALLVLGIALQTLFRSAWFVLADSDQIELSGARQVTRPQVVAIFGADLGRNVFFIPLEQRRQAIENIDWVRSATVMRLWPARVQVRIRERQPIAFARTVRGLRLIDADGVLLDRPPGGDYSFPVLTGLASAGGVDPNDGAAVAQRRAQMSLYIRMRDDLNRNGANRMDDFSEIDLHDPADVQATVVPGSSAPPTLIHFGDEHFYDRYQLFLAHIQEWRQSYPNMAWVELQFDGQAIVDTGAVAPPAPAPAAAGHGAPGGGRGKTKPGGRGQRSDERESYPLMAFRFFAD